MGAIDAVGTAVGAVERNPVPLYAVGAAVAVGGGLVSAAAQLPIPLVGLLLALLLGAVWLFVEPFLAGGFLGMLDESMDDETTFETLKAVGREHYTDLLVARVVVLVAGLAYGLVVGVVLFVLLVVLVGVALSADTAADPGAGTSALAGTLVPAVLVAVVGLAWLVQAAVGLFVQFYAAAIVLDGEGVVDGFERSYRLVRGNVRSVLGYSAIAWIVAFLAGLPATALVVVREFFPDAVGATARTSPQAAMTPSGADVALFVVLAVLLVLGRLVVLPPLRAYHVAYYRDLARG